MKPSLKWSLVFGGGAALLNFVTGFITSLCGLLFSPLATALASFVVLNDGPRADATKLGAKIGLVVGGIGSMGLLMGAAAASLLWNLPFLGMALATMKDLSDFSELGTVVGGFALGAFSLIALALLVSLISTGLCVAIGAIVGRTMALHDPTPGSPAEDQSR